MLAYLFLVFAVAVHVRFLPLPYSFAPVTAALLYFGARRPRKEMWIPVAALAVAGLYLSRSVYAYAFSADLLVTWAWYAAMVLLGGVLAKNASALRVGAVSLAASVSFFVVSNFAVWAVWNMYPKNCWRIDDVLRGRSTVLPQCGGVRPVLCGGILRHRIPGEPSAGRGSYRREIAGIKVS